MISNTSINNNNIINSNNIGGSSNSSLICNSITLTDGSNNLIITPTTGFSNASTITTTTDNSNSTCYIPFSKTGASINSALFVDDTTGPLTYNPSSGALVTTLITCARYDNTSNSASGTVFNNAITGNTTYSNSTTTGSISIGALAMTTGSINIGSTTATTGLCGIRPPLVCSRQIRTTNSNAYPPTSNVLDLGYTSSIFGSSFLTNVLASNTITTVASFSFTPANFGTYLFNSSVLITPDDVTGNRQIDSSIAVTSGLEIPYFSRAYVTSSSTQPPTLNVTRVVPIYVSLSIVLTCRCQNSSATILTTGNNGLFTYTRIA
jgi:hypothetical protein